MVKTCQVSFIYKLCILEEFTNNWILKTPLIQVFPLLGSMELIKIGKCVWLVSSSQTLSVQQAVGIFLQTVVMCDSQQ